MPLGVFKVALLGSGAGSESGWVVEPTTSTHGDGWIYGVALDSENNVWFTQLASSVNQLPIGQVMADGTAGAANNWKSMDPKGGNYGSGRGVAIDSTNGKIYLAGDGINDAGSQYETLFVGMTDGTLVQDWDVMRAYSSGHTFFYQTPIVVGSNHLGGRSLFSSAYIYDSSQSHYFAVTGQNAASDGAKENMTGGSSGSVIRFYGAYGQTIYPVSTIRATTSSNPWVYAAFVTSTQGRTGFYGCQVNTTTYNRRAYTFNSGTTGSIGGIAECDATYLYLTCYDYTGNTMHLLKVAKSDGAISWQRKVAVTSMSASGNQYVTPPVLDSSGNIYVAWTGFDSQSIVDTAYRVHWMSWDSSGNVRTLDGTTMKSFFCVPGHGSPAYVSAMDISSDDNFIYPCGQTNSPADPFIGKFPTDGTGTDNSSALSGNTDGTYYYRNDIAHTESAGNMSYDSEYANISNWADWNQVDDDVNDATQASSVAVRLDALA
tara:strand:- start:2336 stop:3799 length:1464 start_codon:yes stop_codon:yes gene_type:complete